MNKRISYIIDTLKIKKVEFAKKLYISQPFVTDMCSGKSRPSDRTINDICRVFNVNEKWLRSGDGEPFISKQELPQKLIDDYNLNELDIKFIKAFLSLSEVDREGIINLIKKIQLN